MVGAHEHRGRSDIEVDCVAATKLRAKAHLGCDPSHQVWIVRTSGKGNTLSYQRVFPLEPYMHAQAGVACVMIYLGGKDGLG